MYDESFAKAALRTKAKRHPTLTQTEKLGFMGLKSGEKKCFQQLLYSIVRYAGQAYF